RAGAPRVGAVPRRRRRHPPRRGSGADCDRVGRARRRDPAGARTRASGRLLHRDRVRRRHAGEQAGPRPVPARGRVAVRGARRGNRGIRVRRHRGLALGPRVCALGRPANRGGDEQLSAGGAGRRRRPGDRFARRARHRRPGAHDLGLAFARLSSVIRPQLVRSFTSAALSPDPDLAVAALMIARIEYPTLDASPYLEQLDAIGEEARRRVDDAHSAGADMPPEVDPERYAKVMALNEYLFAEMRFVGNEVHYEDPRSRKCPGKFTPSTGSPARRGMPYAEDLIIDAFHGGALLSREMLQRRYESRSAFHDHLGDSSSIESRLLPHATKPQILARMLLNLKRVYVRMLSFPQARDITELLIAVDPSAHNELRDRGLLAYHLKDFPAALRDLQAYLQLTSSSRLDQEE